MFSVKQPCKDSICCYLANGGALPLQERGWGETAFLTQHTGLEMSASTAAAPVVFGVFCFSRKMGSLCQELQLC